MNKKIWVAGALIPMFVLAGCGAATTQNNTTAPTTSPANQSQNATTNNTSDNTTQPAAATQTALKQQEVDLTVLPGGRLGPDGKMHDVITNADFTVVQGVPVKLTVYNYDSGTHTVTNSALGLNLQAKASTKNGVPGVTTVTFTPKKAGDFTWQCMDPCDGQNNAWSMSHDGYMRGTIHVVPQSTDKQFIYLTIKDGLQYAAADGKLHDSYSPASFTVQKGIPVQVTVANYDTGQHSLTATEIGLNQVMKGAAKAGDPSVTTFTFTPSKDGKFHWRCMIPCDGGPTGWAMTHTGYMSGYINVVD